MFGRRAMMRLIAALQDSSSSFQKAKEEPGERNVRVCILLLTQYLSNTGINHTKYTKVKPPYRIVEIIHPALTATSCPLKQYTVDLL